MGGSAGGWGIVKIPPNTVVADGVGFLESRARNGFPEPVRALGASDDDDVMPTDDVIPADDVIPTDDDLNPGI